jgi:hypothetical protein
MKVLQPISEPQTIKIVPRQYIEANDLVLTITQDGTSKSEVLSNLVSVINGNYIDIEITSNIMTEGELYFIELTQGSTLLYRDKAFCTSQTDKSVEHTLNTNQYEQNQAYPTGQQYIMR